MSRFDHSNNELPHKIDVKDEKILDILSQNSRLPISQISKKIELKRETTAYRIKNLEEKQIIEFSYPEIEFSTFGFSKFHFLFVVDESQNLDKFISYLKSLQYTRSLIEYSDRWDFEYVFLAKSIKEADFIMMDILTNFSNIIIERAEIIEIEQYKSILFSYHYNKNEMILNKNIPFDKKLINSIDIEILNELSHNIKKTTFELSKTINLSPDAIGIRIKKLFENGVIYRATICPNLTKIGFNWYSFGMSMKFFDEAIEKKFKSYIAKHNRIIICLKSFGYFDLYMYIMAKNQKEFHKIVKELKSLFAHSIKNYATYIGYKEHYFNSFPKIISQEFLEK